MEHPAVPVTVHRIELISDSAPELVFRATVSAGTYLRALARDLGQRLGVGAHLTALRRESIGALRWRTAVPLERVSAGGRPPGPRACSADLPAVELDEAARRGGGTGGRCRRGAEAGGDVALVFGGELVAVARVEDGWLRPRWCWARHDHRAAAAPARAAS